MIEAKVRKLAKLTIYVSLSCYCRKDNKDKIEWVIYDDFERIHRKFYTNKDLEQFLNKRIEEVEAESA